VELSAEEGVLLGLDGGNEGSAVWHQAVGSDVPERLEIKVGLESFWSDSKSVAVVSIVVCSKLLSILSKSLIHSSILWVFVKDEWKTNFMKIILSP
jgi:hypothetical protein